MTFAVLNKDTAARAVAVLQRPLSEARLAAYRLRYFMLAMTVGGLVVGLLGSFAIARGITVPLRTLNIAVGTIAEGNYREITQINARDEVGALARAFNQMREKVAAREATILDLAYRDHLTQLPNRAAQRATGSGHRRSSAQRCRDQRAAARSRRLPAHQ